MRLFTTLITLGIVGGGLWWLDDQYPQAKHIVLEKIPATQSLAFEPKISSSKILKDHRRANNARVDIKLAPYLMMDVKYAKNEKETLETTMLWDLTDGEMILDTHTWLKTHGYGDCTQAHATIQDFQIVNVLALHKSLDEKGLKKLLPNVQSLEKYIDVAHRKKLVISHGKQLRLHMANPQFAKDPITKMDKPLVALPTRSSERLPKQFSAKQIAKTAEAAFGSDFAIRKMTEVYLPIYALSVTQGDNVQTLFFNSMTGDPY